MATKNNVVKKWYSRLKKNDLKGDALELKIADDSTPFAIRQAYKTLYTNVLYLNIEDKCKKIAVTSAIPGECKTTVACNLAVTIAQNSEEKRVLVIDTDIRAPRVTKLFGLDNHAHGLSEYLAGIDEEPNLISIPEHRVTVLTAGGKSVNPTKLVGSKKMEELINKCSEQFDYIIVDTPPINVVSDAVFLNNLVNGYIIAAKADHSDVKNINECLETLNRVGAEVYGFVLSSLKLKTGSGRYGRYGRYSKYNKYTN